MPTERRHGRTEETHLMLANMIKRASHDIDVLMGILMRDETKSRGGGNNVDDPYGSSRQRKQGTSVRHPLDMVDVNKPVNSKRVTRSASMMEYRPASMMEHQQPPPPLPLEKENKKRTGSLSFLPLRRAGSITSSIVSRKSSSRSIGSNRSKGTNRSYMTNRSNGTITSTSSYIRKNSGNFDGGNSRSRRKSASSLQRKASTASTRREQMIAEFYRDLEELEEMSSDDSSDDDEETGEGASKKLKKGKIDVEEVQSHQRVEEYLMRLENSDISNFEEDEGIISDTTNKSDMSEGKFDSSYNSNHSMDISSSSFGGSNRNRRYIKRPSPPENIIKDLETSPTTQRQRLREERYSDSNNRGVLLDINRNTQNKSSRALPPHPRGVTLIDKTLRDSFNSKNERTAHHRLPSTKDLFDTASESSCSTDSAHGSTRSISTVSSVSVAQQQQIHQRHHHFHLPKNFIPGHTKQTPEQRGKKNALPPNYTNVKPRKVSFCFRGIPFRVYNNSPRTYRALAHAGCIGLIIPAPENHKCKH